MAQTRGPDRLEGAVCAQIVDCAARPAMIAGLWWKAKEPRKDNLIVTGTRADGFSSRTGSAGGQVIRARLLTGSAAGAGTAPAPP